MKRKQLELEVHELEFVRTCLFPIYLQDPIAAIIVLIADPTSPDPSENLTHVISPISNASNAFHRDNLPLRKSVAEHTDTP